MNVGRLILWRAPDVEARTSPGRGPQWLTLPERSDRYREGDRAAHDPTCPPRWAQTIGRRARGAEPMDRVSVEGVAQRPAAEEHGARLSGTVELGRHVGAHPPHALRGGARAGGT